MSGLRCIETELLAEDLRAIKDFLPSGMDEDAGLAHLSAEAMELHRQDEATWLRVQHQHNEPAEAAQFEMKRRETVALVVSMRSRTIRSEIEMHKLREHVHGLQERHAEQRARAEELQRSVSRLRRRIAQVEDRLSGRSAGSESRRSRSSLRKALALIWRRHG